MDGLKRWLELFCLKSFSFKDSWAGFAILFLEGFGRNHIIIKEKKGSRTREGKPREKRKIIEQQPQVLRKTESSGNNLEQKEDTLILEFFFSFSLLYYLT